MKICSKSQPKASKASSKITVKDATMMGNIRQNLRYSGLAALLAQALPPEQENL